MTASVPGNSVCREPVCSPVGSLDGFPFSFQQPDNIAYVLGYDWPFGGAISELRITTSNGEGEVSVLINGQVVTGIDHQPLTAGTRSRFQATNKNTFAPGDDIILLFDSGAPALLDVRGTLVIANKTIFNVKDNLPPGIGGGLVPITIPIVGVLIGAMEIPYVPNPFPLHRNPSLIYPAIMQKNAAGEENIGITSIHPIAGAGDFAAGWVYNLGAEAVKGQKLQGAFIR